jgi:dihydropteroate synthase
MIDMINDVSGVDDFDNAKIAYEYDLPIVVMHHLTIPTKTNVFIPKDQDPILYLKHWAYVKYKYLISKGIKHEKIIFDPGIGFGKTRAQSVFILKNIAEFKSLDFEIYVGHSRKSFLKFFPNLDEVDVDIKTAMFSLYLKEHGVDYLRVHNVKMTKSIIDAHDEFKNITLKSLLVQA